MTILTEEKKWESFYFDTIVGSFLLLFFCQCSQGVWGGEECISYFSQFRLGGTQFLRYGFRI